MILSDLFNSSVMPLKKPSSIKTLLMRRLEEIKRSNPISSQKEIKHLVVIDQSVISVIITISMIVAL